MVWAAALVCLCSANPPLSSHPEVRPAAVGLDGAKAEFGGQQSQESEEIEVGRRSFNGDNIAEDQRTGGQIGDSPGGDVYAWGRNDFGQLGDGTFVPTYQPVLSPVLRGKNITWLSAGELHSIAINEDGYVFAWGDNMKGQLGVSNAALAACSHPSLQSNCMGARPDVTPFPTSIADLYGERVLMTSARGNSNMATTKRVITYGWGENSVGQIGSGDRTDRAIPTQLATTLSHRFVLVAMGGEHAMGLTTLGEVYVWGSNLYGQLGQDTLNRGPASGGATPLSLTPIVVPGLVGKMVIKIAAGYAHCVVLTEDGETWVWGRNSNGQLGLGDKVDRYGPVHVQTGSGRGGMIGFVSAIAAGHSHSIWLNTSGIVFTAGRNDAGQLGVYDSIDRPHVSMVVIPNRIWCDTPVGSQISPGFQDWVCVGSTSRVPCGQRCKGTLRRADCGASNTTAGLQVSDCEPIMPISQRIIKVEAGDYTSHAISEDYNLYSWGSNTEGQIGIGDPDLWGRFIYGPQLVVSLYGKNVSAVAGGLEHTIAKAYREPLYVYSLSPPAGATNGGTSIYIIGQGFNTFTGNLSCLLEHFTNGTDQSLYETALTGNVTIVRLEIKATKFSNFRLECVTPDVRFKLPDGTVDFAKMATDGDKVLTPRNVSVELDGQRLELPGGTLTFEYTGLPGITGIVPEGGPTTGDTYVLIQGYNFDKTLSVDVRVKFGDHGNNWMRGCILTENLIVTVAPPTGPSNSGILDYDGACNDRCPDGFEIGCFCASITDDSESCIRGIVRAKVDGVNKASRRDRCISCPAGPAVVDVRIALNGIDYSVDSVPFTYFDSPTFHYVAPPPWVAQTAWIDGSGNRTYGGPDTGGTVVDIRGVGLEPAALGRAICAFGCSYTDIGNGVGPKCTPGTSRHSLPLGGVFLDEHTFLFDEPGPSTVWDIIHFGTWFKCSGTYDRAGCDTYNATNRTLKFHPGYNPEYAPTFRGYNAPTTVVTSCLEDCESRVEYVGPGLLRCTAPPRAQLMGLSTYNNSDGIDAVNVTLRLKLNGQDLFPTCFTYSCNNFETGALRFTYYRQPKVTAITPNGGPLMDQSFIFVTGTGFRNFAWFPQCLFGKQTTVHLRNSTVFAGWVSDLMVTNTSAYVVNDTLIVCYAAALRPDTPMLLDQERGESFHPLVLNENFAGEDADLTTFADNMIVAGGYGHGASTVSSAFTITLNSQDWADSPGAVPFSFNPRPGTLVEPNNLRFVYYPHPVLQLSVPLGGPSFGRTKLIVTGVGLNAFNEMSRWRGQYDPLEERYSCNGNETCSRPFWWRGSDNPNWFNDTTSVPRPPYVQSDALGWPFGDRNVGDQYPPTTTTSIKCRFGNATEAGNRTYVEDPFWGILDRTEPHYPKSVYADFLDNNTLRCTTPGDVPSRQNLEITLNGREYSAQDALPFVYYVPPETHKLTPSGSPTEGGSTVTVTALGLSRYQETPLCRFGSENTYDPKLDIFVAWDNTTSVATIINDTHLTCQTPFRLAQINAPFSISVNGQDFNFEDSRCLELYPDQIMWDDPVDPKEIVKARVNYSHPFTGVSLFSGCPYIYYRHPTVFALEPAGGPITGRSVARVFGRGFNIFFEDVRCKFGDESAMWVQAHDRPVGSMGRDDEVLCYTPPKLMLSLKGPDVACTFACVAFPDDKERCNKPQCSFWHPPRVTSFRLAVAEIVGTRDFFGDINVLPTDIVIETVKQPRDPFDRKGAPSIDVVFTIRGVRGEVPQQAVADAMEVIDATRRGTMQGWLREYGLGGLDVVEISAEPVPLAITLNGQDYTYRANALFTYYMSPTIFGIAPAGGPLIRYDIADADHRDPTKVEIGGIGMRNYDEKAQCRFGDLVVTATVEGDRLMICDTPWPGVLFRENFCDAEGGGGCVLDVWVEVSLNGFDFTIDSRINFRYYHQPVFPTFSPLGGPVDGGTLVTFFGKGFNRFNDGTLRIQWGFHRGFAEEDPGELQLHDDFDPTPPEVEPLESEFGILTAQQIADLNGTESRVIADDFEAARTLLLSQYKYDRSMWDFSSAVGSNSACGAMDLPNTMAKIDVGYLPGNFSTTRDDIQSRSLYFTGQSDGVLAGRLLISKTVDLSRGGRMSMWLRRGNSSAPLSCERPDLRDELSFSIKPETGVLHMEGMCDPSLPRHACDGEAALSFALCNVTESFVLSQPHAILYNRSKTYVMNNKVVVSSSFLTPRCAPRFQWAPNETVLHALPMEETTDQTHIRVTFDFQEGPGNTRTSSMLLLPLVRITRPEPGANESYSLQTCVCTAVTGCPLPPCADSCRCFVVAGANCSLNGVTPSIARPYEGSTRTLRCTMPRGTRPRRYEVWLKFEYKPDASPPTWAQMGQWRRLRVFDTDDFDAFSYTSQPIYDNHRGVRSSPNRNQLTRSGAVDSLVQCPRHQACASRRARVMLKQNIHGQGDFDAWAIDDVKVNAKGGIVDDTRIIARSPPAKHAVPLAETEDLSWRKDKKLTGTFLKGVDVSISMNNQTYERSGKMNFCRFYGDSKVDAEDPSKTIVCDRQYFNWDEQDWLFQTTTRALYTNWWEKDVVTDWSNQPRFFLVTSQQFNYYQQPTVTGLAPSGGPIVGGTGVTVIGTGFAVFSDPLRTPKCKFGVSIVEARVDEDTRIFCVTPETLQPGYVSVAVSLNEVDFTSPAMGREYSIPFLFYNQPTVSSLSPNTGPSRGGTAVYVIGEGFLQLPSAPACRFVGISDPSVRMDVPGKFLNDTLIECIAPALGDLCTPKHYCRDAVDTDPNWRGCIPWLTCPFVAQCGEVACGCPTGPRCQQLEEDGTKVTRDQVGQDVLFDVSVQVSLNGICCQRDQQGRIQDGCPRCSQPNQRCGCVGDFTEVETDQSSIVRNTFTYYREAELDYEGIMDIGRPCPEGDACHNPVVQPTNGEEFSIRNGDTKPIRLVGKYLRNTTDLRCVYAPKCHRVSECDPPPLELIPNIFGSYYFMDSALVLCRIPEMWGQGWEMEGRAQLFVSLNGVDHTNFCSDASTGTLCSGNGDCPTVGCLHFQYSTPMSPDKIRAIVLGVTIGLTVTIAYILIQRQRYLKKNAKYVADTGGEWEKPSLREAMLWQAERQVRKYGQQHYPLWKTGSAELGQLGVGMGLYFEYLKYMLRYFGVMSAMAVPSMALCNAGIAFKTFNVDFSIRWSLGNIGLGWPGSERLEVFCLDSQCEQGFTLNSRQASFILACADCLIMLVFIFATWRLKIFQERAIIAIDEDTITASDYSILVEGIPSDAKDADEIRAFFSRYGEVADVAIGLNNGRLISMFQKRGKLEIKVEEQVARLKLYKLQALQQQLKKMKKQQHKLDNKIAALRNKTDSKAVVAYVTFNEESGQEECLESYNFNLFTQLMGRHKGKVRTFRGRYHLRVSQAPEPSNVLWENLQHRGLETFFRASIANLITSLLLFVSFTIVISVKAVQESLQVDGGALVCNTGPDPEAYDVQEQIVWAKYSQSTSARGTALYQTYLECYCGPDFGKKLEKERDFCNDYVTNQQTLSALAIGSVGVVLAINQLLQLVLKILAGTLEKPHTISAWEKGIASRIFVAQWINTGLLITIVNADWNYHLPILKGTVVGSAFTGTFKDFEEGWYQTVGTALVRQSATAALSPNIAVLAQWPLMFVKQWVFKNRELTQRKLNTLFEGAEYLLSKRYGALLNILFVILTYSSSLPLLYIFGVLFFSSAYWCDKIAILRAMKQPAHYDEKLAVFCTLMMSVGIFIHLAFGVWFFAYVDGDVLNTVQWLLDLVFQSRFFTKRLVKQPAFIVFMTLLAFIVFEILGRTVGPTLIKQLVAAIRGTTEEVKEGNPSFFEAQENQEIAGLDSYNIRKNPRYRDAFQSEIQTEAAESDDDSDDDDDFDDDSD